MLRVSDAGCRTYPRRRGQRPAFESRQGTKAREFGTRLSGHYGEFVDAAGAANGLADG